MTDFEAMGIMSKENKDIRASFTLLEVTDYPKAGAAIKMRVDSKTAQDVMRSINGADEQFYVGIYIINKKQFDEVKESANFDKKK